MPKISKSRTTQLTNKEFADLASFSIGEVEVALRNYAAALSAAATTNEPAETLVRAFEEAGFGAIDLEMATALIAAGPPTESFAEIAETPGIGFSTLRRMVPALLKVDVPGAGQIGRARRPIVPRERIDANAQLEAVTTIALSALGGPRVAFLSDDLLDRLEDIADDAERIGDAAEETKDSFDSARDAAKELRRALEEFRRSGKRPDASAPGLGGPQTNETVPTAFNGVLTEDTYGKIFGDALKSEPLYTVWFDRWMAFEVDGFGDDNTVATVEVTVIFGNPAMTVRTSFITGVYNIDEREEYRLKPSLPIEDRRALPLDDDDWEIRGFLEERDAALALRVGGTVRGIPLSRLDEVVIRYYLYESDRVQALINAVAAVGAAAIAALSVIKGGFAVPAGGTGQLTDAIRTALEKLNTLINKDEKLLYGSFTFRPSHFRAAFENGQTFAVRDHASLAACGLDFQRDGGGVRENGKPVDLVGADAFFAERQDDLDDPDFYEDEFDSYYELRLRFERVDPETTGN